MADDKKDALAQEPDNTKAVDTADNKDAKELSADELGAVAGGILYYCGTIELKNKNLNYCGTIQLKNPR